MIGFEDWLVTLHNLIDAKTPLIAKHDGHDQADHLLGNCHLADLRCIGNFRVMVDSRRLDGKLEGIRQKMLRKGKNHDPLKIELYDLAADLSETEDLASKHPDIVEKIRK